MDDTLKGLDHLFKESEKKGRTQSSQSALEPSALKPPNASPKEKILEKAKQRERELALTHIRSLHQPAAPGKLRNE